jgi:hypothetical protein
MLVPRGASAGDAPFTGPANWGGTGLMEIPTARVLKENSFRVGFSQIKPYRYFYGAISPLKGLEIDGRITELLDVSSGLKDQKNFKDKAIDFKYQFIPEGKFMPAVALGIMDPHGTRVYPSQYIVASKQIYPFDFTIGFGNGRFGEKPLPAQGEGIQLEIFENTQDWLRDSQFFGGIQLAVSDNLSLMVEYSPIEFHKQTRDPAQKIYFQEPVPSKFNAGFRYKPVKWAELGLSYQRGNEIGFHLSTAFDIGKPLIPIYNRVYRESPLEKQHSVENRLTGVLHKSGFSDIGISLMEGELWIEAQNEKYFYNVKAIGIILDVLNNVSPEGIHRIHIILKENDVPLLKFTTTQADISELYEEKLSPAEFLYLSEFNTGIPAVIKKRGAYRKPLRYGIKPSFETFINDPAGFFKYRLGVSGWMSYHPWKGASFVSSVATYPLNNIETTNEPLSIPVRSDLVNYKKKNLSLNRLLFDQISKLTPDIFGKFSAGLLEVQYAGVDAEIAMPVLNGRVLIGVSGSAVKKRDPENPFKIKNDDVKDVYTTAFLNTRLNIPELNAALDLKAGRFLAGDAGVRFTVYKYINGVKLWAWYTITDTSDFSDPFNRDYHDKGIGVSIPLRLFAGTDSRTAYYYSLSPWTRDTGQDIYHYNTLFDFIGRNVKIFLDKDRKFVY